MQSAHGYINILPALPKVWEATGEVTGMKAIGNFTVGFNWQDGKAQKVTIVSNAGAELKVRCKRGAMDIAKAKITVNGAEVGVLVSDNGIACIPCEKGQTVVIDFTAESSLPSTKFVEVEISEYNYATFYANEAMTVPENVTAYVATTVPEIEDGVGTISMTAIDDDVVPANTGALIHGEKGKYIFTETSASGTPVTGNMLLGYAGAEEYEEVALPTDGSTNYILGVKDGKVGFYRKDEAFKVYNHKAYLNLPASAAGARAIYFDFGGETGIDEVKTENGSVKTDMYDLAGRRVKQLQKGVYIVNGKVRVVK